MFLAKMLFINGHEGIVPIRPRAVFAAAICQVANSSCTAASVQWVKQVSHYLLSGSD